MRAPDFWAADKGSGAALAALLAPLGLAYDLAGRLRRATTRGASVGVPVVCAGNLVAGGAGKTPVALALAAALAADSRKVHLLTRGYGGNRRGPCRVDLESHGTEEVGDEALLLAHAAPTWVARDRLAGAQAAVAAGAQVIVMDDGFQNPSLAKDLSLLVVDGGYGFGNGRILPAGPLRERIDAGLARADAVVLIEPDARNLAPRLAAVRPLLRARLQPAAGAPDLAGRRVLAFAGIGRPEKFFASLRQAGATLVATRAFPDHHPYGRQEIEDLLAEAETSSAQAITTEKDAVRLPPALRARVAVLPVVVAWQDTAELDRLLQPLANGS